MDGILRALAAGIEVETPCYICDLGALRRNLDILARAQERAGCKILLALKGFAMWSVFPIIREYLSGVAASSPSEAMLGREEFCRPAAGPGGHPGTAESGMRGHEVHAYAPAYSAADIDELVPLVDHMVFNSVAQFQALGGRARARAEALGRELSFGLRVNPSHSEVKVPIYDPCAPRSRLGIPPPGLPSPSSPELSGISGLHFHTLCELGADALERTLAAVEHHFAEHLKAAQWVNFGGGHHITRPDYDVDLLVALVQRFRERYDVEVYLEPGEAIAIGTGVLVTTVLDIIDNDGPIAIVDTSATAHMPDVLEMPYRPDIHGAAEPGRLAHTYRLGGLTCLAGDVIGDYAFAAPLHVGERLTLLDMAHYTMVKNTTFNGVRLPSIATYDPESDHLEVVRRFAYEDYKGRLS